jgi:hypothetical protein
MNTKEFLLNVAIFFVYFSLIAVPFYLAAGWKIGLSIQGICFCFAILLTKKSTNA